MKTKHRLLALLLALLMLVSLLPTMAAAEEGEGVGGVYGSGDPLPAPGGDPPSVPGVDTMPGDDPAPGDDLASVPGDDPAPAPDEPLPLLRASAKNAPVEDGEALFTAEVEAEEGAALSYQWQQLDARTLYADKEARENAWTDLADETGSTLRLTGLDELEALRAAAPLYWRCRVSTEEDAVCTDEVCLELTAQDYDAETVSGLAPLAADELTVEGKPVLLVLERDTLPKELSVFLGGTALFAPDGTLLAVRDAAPAALPVAWVCQQDYDEALDSFDFTPQLDGYTLAEGLALPSLRVNVSEPEIGPLTGHIMSGVTDVPIVGSNLRGTANDSYNAFDLGLLPVVRNQGNYGTCWTFAAVGSMEADLIHDGLADTDVDLSELSLAYYSSHTNTALRTHPADQVSIGIDQYLLNGGNNFFSFRTMALGSAPVWESDMPYPNGQVAGTPTVQLRTAYVINSSDIPAIKTAIRSHGAVDASIYFDRAFFSFTHNSLCTNAGAANHEIMLVGWDDNFSSTNFGSVHPVSDGAWLVRNSWGKNDYGYDGYFWVSYYDSALLADVITAYDAEPRDFTYCYSYSGYAFPMEWLCVESGNSIQQSYVLADAETIKSVGFETNDVNLSGTVTVSAVVNGETVSVSTPVWTSYVGFYNVPLNEPLSLPKGTKVTVSLRFDSDAKVAVEKYAGSRTACGAISYTSVFDGGGYTLTGANGAILETAQKDARIMLYTDPGASAVAPTEVTAISLNKTHLDLTSGEYELLTATLTPDTADAKLLSWVSSDPNVVSVIDGLVTANEAGTAEITVYARSGISAVCTVKVQGVPVTGLRLTENLEVEDGCKVDRANDEMFAGYDSPDDPLDLSNIILYYTYEILPKGAGNKKVHWSVSDPSVLAMDPNTGIGTILANGTTLVTVTADDTTNGTFSDSVKLIVDLSTYAICFDANEGSGAPEPQTKYRYLPLTLSDVEPRRPDYAFLGWAESPTAEEPEYLPGGKYTLNEGMTLYAVWAPALKLTPEEVDSLAEMRVSVDGVSCAVYDNGDIDTPAVGTARVIEAFAYNDSESDDPHSRYPVALKVWLVRDGEDGQRSLERVEALDDVLQYSGYSIRISGKRGIRMISSVPTRLKKTLIARGVAGYRLEEYGTVVGWAEALNGEDLVMSNALGHAHAYRRGVGDPVFRTVNGLTQYTNVLVNFTDEQVTRDLVMRSYMILSDGTEQIILYGGPVQRSIGYVAYQNRNAFKPGSAAYEYVWALIRITYGDLYDEEYQGAK